MMPYDSKILLKSGEDPDKISRIKVNLDSKSNILEIIFNSIEVTVLILK